MRRVADFSWWCPGYVLLTVGELSNFVRRCNQSVCFTDVFILFWENILKHLFCWLNDFCVAARYKINIENI